MFNKSVIASVLITAQLYFCAVAANFIRDEWEKRQTINETFLTTSFVIYASEASILNKTTSSEKVLSSQQFLNDGFYTTILTKAEKLGLLFFVNSQENPNRLLSLITEESVYRSPPLI